MIEIYKEELLKDTMDYEEYSENVCTLTIEELKAEGLLKCGGCCTRDGAEKNKCGGCKSKKSCKGTGDKN